MNLDLRAGQKKKSYIGFIQGNSIESFLHDCLPYISKTNGLCSTTLAYPK